VYAMQGDIRGEHIEEMKIVVMRDSVRVSRHLLGVWFDSEDGFCFLQARRLQGLTARRQGLADERDAK